MKKIYFILKGSILLITAPAAISKGQRRRAIKQAKKVYSRAGLF